MLKLTFPVSEVGVEQVEGRFTLYAVDLDAGIELVLPLSAEGADMLRADMLETTDTAIQVLLHESDAGREG